MTLMGGQKRLVRQGKTSKDENFPVGSFLIPAKIRPHVLAYYNFARTADDIADSPLLTAKQKVRKLDALEDVLLGKAKVTDETKCSFSLAKSMEITRVDVCRATDLLVAFRMDAMGAKYDSWPELMNYCKYSANPVGRYMLDLFGESKDAYWPSDMLCSALQVLNHIQDMKQDWLDMKRSYMPKVILKKHNVSEKDFIKDKLDADLRKAVDEVLELTFGLLCESSTIPMVIYNLGLRMEVCTIHALALRLWTLLKNPDILANHIQLAKKDWLLGTLKGIGNGLWREKIKLNKKQ